MSTPLYPFKLNPSKLPIIWWKDGNPSLKSDVIQLSGITHKVFIEGTISVNVDPPFVKIDRLCSMSRHVPGKHCEFNGHCCYCHNCHFAHVSNCFACITIQTYTRSEENVLVALEDYNVFPSITIPMTNDIPEHGIQVEFPFHKGITVEGIEKLSVSVELTYVSNIKNENVIVNNSDVSMAFKIYTEKEEPVL